MPQELGDKAYTALSGNLDAIDQRTSYNHFTHITLFSTTGTSTRRILRLWPGRQIWIYESSAFPDCLTARAWIASPAMANSTGGTTAPTKDVGPEYIPSNEKPTATVSTELEHPNVHILPQTPQLIALLT